VSRSVRTAAERNRARRWMKEAYRANKALLRDPLLPKPHAVNIVFLLRVRGDLPRRKEIRESINQAMVTLLKELHQHLAEKS
jgi:RNase P protein component